MAPGGSAAASLLPSTPLAYSKTRLSFLCSRAEQVNDVWEQARSVFRALISHRGNVIRLFQLYLPSRLPEV